MERQMYDFIIVGSGAGSVPAALTIKRHGKTVLIIEKQGLIGGTTAFSGGVIWIPNNHILNEAGGNDSPERARTYMDAIVGDIGPATSSARKDAFIRNGNEMVRALQERGMKFVRCIWPDYFDTAPGGHAEGRSLTAPLFNVKELGEWAPKLGRHPITSMMPIAGNEANAMFTMKVHMRGKVVMAKALLRMARDKLLGRTTRGAGNALQGRLFQIALREGIPIWTDTPVKDLTVEDGRVTGVVVEREGKTIELGAELGVLLNTGGFARNQRMRDQYLPKPTSLAWTQANPGDTGEMMETAMKLGAAIDQMEEATWDAQSFLPDGSLLSFHSPNDIGKPHCIAVGPDGKRFADENQNYMEFGQRTYAAGATPAWAIFDSQHRDRYMWGVIPPGAMAAKKYVDMGYLKRADTIEELAGQCGLDPAALAATVERFNGFARAGLDEDFHRGESAYARFYGDYLVKPNASMGPIERGPFYAVRMEPGDLGTTGGLVCDEHSRVLRTDGSVIAGLYATGNTAASVMGRRYLGAGATVGPSMVFGYIAAKHAVGAN